MAWLGRGPWTLGLGPRSWDLARWDTGSVPGLLANLGHGSWVWAQGPGFWVLWPLGPWSLGPGGLGPKGPGRLPGREKTGSEIRVLGMSVKAFWALL